MVIRDEDHPITNGLLAEFMHANDELYERLRGPVLNMNVLATAFASPDQQASGRHEPTMMIIDFGKIVFFTRPLVTPTIRPSVSDSKRFCLRGTKWAATGNVTIAVPENFPTADKSSSRTFEVARSAEPIK